MTDVLEASRSTEPQARGEETAAPGFCTDYDLPYPAVDFNQVNDPIPHIVSSEAYVECAEFLHSIEAASRSLIGPWAQALLYAFIRNLRPEHVFEIGVYKASSTEAICRALEANDHGVAQAVDPYGHQHGVEEIFASWPPELGRRVRFHPVSSMDFFVTAMLDRLLPDLVFVDGCHEYPYALFDIQSGARLLKPGGFIFVDNIAQPGPFMAARDFLRLNPAWQECGGSCIQKYRPAFAFDRERATVKNTDFCVIRAPRDMVVGSQPYSPGTETVAAMEVSGMLLHIAKPATGKLHVQGILRSFGERWYETEHQRSISLAGVVGESRMALAFPYRPEEARVHRTVELWLTWEGDEPLYLATAPVPY